MELTEMNLTEEWLADVQRYVQLHEDRIRTDYSKRLKDVNDEFVKYKPVEKSETEEALEERLSVLKVKEREIANKERVMTIADKLKEKELPTELVKCFNIGDDLDTTIDELGAMFGNYFLNRSNKSSNHNTHKGVTKQDFNKMSYAEREKMFQENPILYQD